MITMTSDLEEKVYNLQKNVLELHNLFDLNMAANQSRSMEDLLSKVAVLVKSSIDVKKLRFFLNNNGIFQTKNIASNSDIEFEFNGENAPFLQNPTDELIKVVNHDGSLIYKAFWSTYKLDELETKYIKVFYTEGNAFCVCSLSAKEDNTEYSEEDLKYLNQVFLKAEMIFLKTLLMLLKV